MVQSPSSKGSEFLFNQGYLGLWIDSGLETGFNSTVNQVRFVCVCVFVCFFWCQNCIRQSSSRRQKPHRNLNKENLIYKLLPKGNRDWHNEGWTREKWHLELRQSAQRRDIHFQNPALKLVTHGMAVAHWVAEKSLRCWISETCRKFAFCIDGISCPERRTDSWTHGRASCGVPGKLLAPGPWKSHTVQESRERSTPEPGRNTFLFPYLSSNIYWQNVTLCQFTKGKYLVQLPYHRASDKGWIWSQINNLITGTGGDGGVLS